MKKLIKSNKGMALPWALFILAMIIIVGASLIQTMNSEIIQNKSYYDKIKAKYIAEAGMNESFSLYGFKDDSTTFPVSAVMDTGSYTVEYSSPNTLISIGNYKTTNYKLLVQIDDATGTILKWRELHE